MIIYGKQIVLYALQNTPYLIEEFYLAKEVDKRIFWDLQKLGVKILKVDHKKAQAMARGGNHQGFLAKIKALELGEKTEIFKMSSLVVLCGVSDVGNLGSMIRSAYAMGIDGVIMEGELKERAIEGMIRASAGAMLKMFVYCTPNVLELINEIKMANFVCFGADMGGEEISSVKTSSQKWALFLGSEGEGLKKKILQKMDTIISINMKNNFDSLNVAVAGGILMHRLVYQ